MDWLAALKTYPPDALPYEIGFLLLAVSLVWYSMLLKKMIAIIHERPVWLLPLIGAGFIISSIIMHSYAYLVFFPQLDFLHSVDDINRMTAFLMKWRLWSLSGILCGGICALLGGGIYYRWTSR